MSEDPYRLELKDEEKERIGGLIIERIRTARLAMDDMLKKVDDWQELYESNLPGKNFPWDGCSNVNIPLIQSHVDTWHASINDIIFGVSPYFLIRPMAVMTGTEAKQAAQRIENVIQDIQTNSMNMAFECDKLHLNSLMQPVGIIKLTWKDVKRNTKKAIKSADGSMDVVDDIETAYRGPKMEIVDIRNFVVYPLTAVDAEDAVLIGDRKVITRDTLKSRMLSGLYDKEAVQSILDKPQTEESRASDNSTSYQNDLESIDNVPTEEFVIWEVIMKHEYNEGEEAKDCVFTVEEESGKILRAIKFPYWHNRRYYIPIKPFIRPSQRFFGRTLPQILEHCQKELNAIHNQRVDAVSLCMSKPLKRLRGSNMNTDSILIHPGSVIDVDTIDEITELQINPAVPGADVEMQSKEWSERASPINDIAAGKDMSGSRATAREVSIVASKGNLRINDVVNRIQQAYIEVTEQILGLLYQFTTDQELMNMKVSRDELKVPWLVIPHGDMGTVDKTQKRQDALFKYQTLIMNPIVMQDPVRVHRITADLLAAFDVSDIESYIGSEEELTQKIAEQKQQAALMQAMGGGQPNEAGQPEGTMGGASQPMDAGSQPTG